MDEGSVEITGGGRAPTVLTNGHHSGTTTDDVLNTPSSHADGDFFCEPRRCNDPAKPWIVQKFGGTSVAKASDVIAKNIIGSWMERYRVIAVCSARSKGTKATGTTNRLLRAAKEAANGQREAWSGILREIHNDHLGASQALISEKLRLLVNGEIASTVKKLEKILGAIQEIGEVSAKSLDIIISKGELLSCQLMTSQLRDVGIQAQWVDLSAIVDFEGTEDLDNTFYERLTDRLVERVRACGNSIPVLTGYFGPVTGGLLNNIGRGYSDLCAALAAIGMKAEELHIWKEIDGIFTANPSKVPTARLLSKLTPSEAAELTFYGSEVIHPFTMEKVIKARIPIRIRNVLNLRNPGTVIEPEPIPDDRPLPPASPTFFRQRSSSKPVNGERPPRPTAITSKRKILVINVHSNKRSLSHGFFASIFDILDKWKLSVDLISTSEVHVSMALHSGSAIASASGDDEKETLDASLEGAINDLAHYGTVDILTNMVIISLVGKQMKRMTGIAGKMFTVLGSNDINVEMISQGASEINISCVIEENCEERAISLLHTNLFTFLET